MKGNKVAKYVTIISILIIIACAVTIVLILNNNNSQPTYSSSDNKTQKTFSSGDSISIEDLETYFKDIYNNYTLLGISLFTNIDNTQYPYITSASINDNNKVNVYFSIDDILLSATYDRTSSDLDSVLISLIDPSNEKTFKTIVSLSTCECFITDSSNNLDMTISNGIRSSLNNDSEEFKQVYNKYKDVVWITRKTTTIDDKGKFVSLYISKN